MDLDHINLQQLAAHLINAPEHVLDPRARSGDAFVTQPLPLDLISEAVLLQPDFTLRRRIAPVGIDVPTRAGRVGLDIAGGGV